MREFSIGEESTLSVIAIYHMLSFLVWVMKQLFIFLGLQANSQLDDDVEIG